MTASTMNFKLDETLKAEFNQLAKDLGLTSTGLLTLFVKKAVDVQGVPFDVVVTKPRYHEDFYKMLEVENQKTNGAIPDDSVPVSRGERQRWREGYE